MDRIDIILVKNGYVSSRSKAAELISLGKVYVNDKAVLKNSMIVDENSKIEIKENDLLEYVSRGGLKLEKAINTFNLDFTNKVICDIGASTGGFTSCSLKYGASFVYAIDVGTNQLHPSLLDNERVKSLENLNFKDATLDLFDKKIDYFVCDVSFISIRTILLKIKELFNEYNIVILFKPQFEVGKNRLNKHGVVKDNKYLVEGLNSFDSFLRSNGFILNNMTFSPIKGNKQGNIEFLYYISSVGKYKNFDYNYVVNEAVNVLKVSK